MGELRSNLVGAPGNEFALYQRQPAPIGQHTIIRPAGFAAGLGCIGDKHTVFLCVLEQVPFQTSRLFGKGTLHNGKVPFVNFPVANLLVEDSQRFRIFCCNDNAAGVSVNSVAQCRGEGMLFPGMPFPLLIQVRLNLVNQCSSVFRTVVGMYGQPRPLVYQKNIVILIDDVQSGGGNRQIGVVLSGGFKELIVNVQREHIAGLQTGVPLCPGTVAFNSLDANIFLGEGCR